MLKKDCQRPKCHTQLARAYLGERWMEVPVLAKGLDALFGPVDGLEAISFRETNVLRRG